MFALPHASPCCCGTPCSFHLSREKNHQRGRLGNHPPGWNVLTPGALGSKLNQARRLWCFLCLWQPHFEALGARSKEVFLRLRLGVLTRGTFRLHRINAVRTSPQAAAIKTQKEWAGKTAKTVGVLNPAVFAGLFAQFESGFVVRPCAFTSK